jgi:aryl-alcohol dehydrogenase-like predicted oxidoreductase
MGVIAKRPLANVAWADGDRPPRNGYGYPYWERLQKLKYDFLRADLHDSVATALRFVLTVKGVHTAIVGTSKPERFSENALALEAGTLPVEVFENVRSRGAKLRVSIGQVKLEISCARHHPKPSSNRSHEDTLTNFQYCFCA